MTVIMKRLLTTGIAAFIIGFTFFGTSSLTYAQENTTGNGLEISPALVELNAVRGSTYTINMNVTNVTENDLSFESFVNDFGSRDETGTPRVILDETPEMSALSIKNWVDSIADFNLKPHEKKKLVAIITIPGNAEPGGHYGVIRFSGKDKNAPISTVDLTASAGTLILIKVDGTISEKLKLATFEATKNSKASSSFEAGPITFVTRFENTGNTHVKPIGNIEVTDIFGNKVDTLKINPEEGNVLPSSTRRFEATLDKPWLIGRYNADIRIAYGTTGGAIVESITFWVIPYKILLVGLVALITIIYILRTLIKRYNSYIRRTAPYASKKKHQKK
ncbi:MAG: exported protein of unknown function [Candidatus Saccharibacteria bacterium]|nr:exported protein of unknown function [Candidatus Saccharibacteria bacterium]